MIQIDIIQIDTVKMSQLLLSTNVWRLSPVQYNVGYRLTNKHKPNPNSLKLLHLG